jgi:hypothetical protein
VNAGAGRRGGRALLIRFDQSGINGSVGLVEGYGFDGWDIEVRVDDSARVFALGVVDQCTRPTLAHQVSFGRYGRRAGTLTVWM